MVKKQDTTELMADVLARRWGMKAEVIVRWARDNNVDLVQYAMDTKGGGEYPDFVADVINNTTLSVKEK